MPSVAIKVCAEAIKDKLSKSDENLEAPTYGCTFYANTELIPFPFRTAVQRGPHVYKHKDTVSGLSRNLKVSEILYGVCVWHNVQFQFHAPWQACL